MWFGRTQAHHALAGCVTAIVIAFCPMIPPVQAHPGSVEVDIAAKIKERCGFLPGGSDGIEAPRDIEESARLSLTVKLDCNTPYALGVISEHGALVNMDASDDGSGFAFSKRYRVALTLETDKGTVRSERCNSRDLLTGGRCEFTSAAAGEGLKSGRGISVERNAIITVDWPDQSTLPSRLAAGRYKDTLILVVGPRG